MNKRVSETVPYFLIRLYNHNAIAMVTIKLEPKKLAEPEKLHEKKIG